MGYVASNKPTLVYTEDDLTATVAPAGQDIIVITPPPGYIYKLKSIFYSAPDPVGSSSGTHQAEIKNDSGYISYVQCKSTTGNVVQIQRLELFGDSSEAPSTAIAQMTALLNIICDSNEPLNIVYDNDTDVNQTGTRRCRILFEKIKAMQ